jgi:hypothetical protein
VESFLRSKAQADDAHEACDRYIAHRIQAATGSSFGIEAEFSVVNQILRFHGRPLHELLVTNWGCKSAAPILKGMTVLARTSASIDDLNMDVTDLFPVQEGTLLRVIRPREGIVLPDAAFFASADDGGLCLVTVQVKSVSKKLKPFELDEAIRSTSTLLLTSPFPLIMLKQLLQVSTSSLRRRAMYRPVSSLPRCWCTMITLSCCGHIDSSFSSPIEGVPDEVAGLCRGEAHFLCAGGHLHGRMDTIAGGVDREPQQQARVAADTVGFHRCEGSHFRSSVGCGPHRPRWISQGSEGAGKVRSAARVGNLA